MKPDQGKKVTLTIIIAALGYFVDIYELLLFSIVRKPSLLGIGVIDLPLPMLEASTKVINWQMTGLLLGGILWGVIGDKRGRLSVLFGSILLYSVANFATGYVQTVNQYAWARFIGGIGLAGELGAGITLVSELLPRSKRGMGTSLVAGVGLLGAVFAFFIFKLTNDWRLCYKIGGVMGIGLLLMRVSIVESLMYHKAKITNVEKGNFFMFFTNLNRFKKYALAILIGLPTWYVIGILMNYSNRFAGDLYPNSNVDSGEATMFGYIGISLGDIAIGFVSQYFRSRKKALYIFYALTIIACGLYFSPFNTTDSSMYFICGLLGFSSGFWAIFVTMGAEQFGTNLRATAATTIPNMVRGSLPLMNMLFLNLFQETWQWSLVTSGIVTGIIVILIALVSAKYTQETFMKKLNYFEKD
jgi:MFS transporter, putative metabolite:H+ symporter